MFDFPQRLGKGHTHYSVFYSRFSGVRSCAVYAVLSTWTILEEGRKHSHHREFFLGKESFIVWRTSRTFDKVCHYLLAFFIFTKYYFNCLFVLVSSHHRTRKASPSVHFPNSTPFPANILSMETILSVFHPAGSITVFIGAFQTFGCFRRITIKEYMVFKKAQEFITKSN